MRRVAEGMRDPNELRPHDETARARAALGGISRPPGWHERCNGCARVGNEEGAVNMFRVEALHSMQDVKKLRQEIDELNLASRQPSPFATFEYVETFLAHDEYGTREEELLFLVAFDGARLVGYLPLRKHRDRTLRIPFGRIGVLVSHDTDRPHVVARADDEARCCDAFYRHLLERERGWSLLELAMQDADSGLNTVPPLPRWRYRAHRFETMPNTTVPLKFSSLSEYFKAVPGPQRRNVGRFGRRLLAAGRVEFVACEDPRGGSAMLDLYLNLERRSWKEAAHAGVRRDPRRVELYRALARPGQPMRLGVDLLLLDNLPVAGLIHGAFAGGSTGSRWRSTRTTKTSRPRHRHAPVGRAGNREPPGPPSTSTATTPTTRRAWRASSPDLGRANLPGRRACPGSSGAPGS